MRNGGTAEDRQQPIEEVCGWIMVLTPISETDVAIRGGTVLPMAGSDVQNSILPGKRLTLWTAHTRQN